MEQLQTLRWPLVVLSLLATLGMLYAGSHLVRATTEEGPLRTFLGAQPAVASYRLEVTRAGRQVTVTLRDIPDLGQAVRDLDRSLAQLLGGAAFELKIEDRRTPELTEAFYRINPLVQEALATGRYGDLVDRVEARAASLGVQRARVGIDARRVYVQLHRGSDYLYEVLERPDAPRPAGSETSGGGWSF